MRPAKQISAAILGNFSAGIMSDSEEKAEKPAVRSECGRYVDNDNSNDEIINVEDGDVSMNKQPVADGNNVNTVSKKGVVIRAKRKKSTYIKEVFADFIGGMDTNAN